MTDNNSYDIAKIKKFRTYFNLCLLLGIIVLLIPFFIDSSTIKAAFRLTSIFLLGGAAVITYQFERAAKRFFLMALFICLTLIFPLFTFIEINGMTGLILQKTGEQKSPGFCGYLLKIWDFIND